MAIIIIGMVLCSKLIFIYIYLYLYLTWTANLLAQSCEKLGFNRARLWCEHEPESVVGNKNFIILWDFTIQCDHMIEARRPDIVVADKIKKETIIIWL